MVWIFLTVLSILVVTTIGILAFTWITKDPYEHKSMDDYSRQLFQLSLLFNELVEIHNGKDVTNCNTCHCICQCMVTVVDGAHPAPDITDLQIQQDPEAREKLAAWLDGLGVRLLSNAKDSPWRNLATMVRNW